ncbi:uberolysin/carnocyclin family circular bacteriocin [Agrilactobacillus fermenti]|uniref:uberolysin/carnocyclin family circular bacteriocin n=1 Tax=Agrilactobacillus fermenti TaxID=2586909 RepID=UPI001E362003|nr:uberolysin/carnocyclin family circular bacteriocin [Agrilactobacillus fermenti]MCD2256886.1 circular bacteriocin, circularin A/uberolysin family [Agrilactobacillus fermenti]
MDTRFFVVLTAILGFIFALTLLLSYGPAVATTLGISTETATRVVNIIQAYQTAVAVVSIVAALTGVGAISSGIVSVVPYMLKKKAKGQVALW